MNSRVMYIHVWNWLCGTVSFLVFNFKTWNSKNIGLLSDLSSNDYRKLSQNYTYMLYVVNWIPFWDTFSKLNALKRHRARVSDTTPKALFDSPYRSLYFSSAILLTTLHVKATAKLTSCIICKRMYGHFLKLL